MLEVKMVVVGDGAVGKTSMIRRYTETGGPEDVYIPTVLDVEEKHVDVRGNFVKYTLWDTAGQEDYDALRPLAYPNASIVIICYSVVSRASLDNVISKWVPEIERHLRAISFVLCGLKTDLRTNDAWLQERAARGYPATIVTTEEGRDVAKQVRASHFCECSSLTGDGLKALHETTITEALCRDPGWRVRSDDDSDKKIKCVLM